MLESLRKKISKMPLGLKFVVRILYPITLYLLLYFLLHISMRFGLQNIQLLFIILWILIEWQVFLKKPEKE